MRMSTDDSVPLIPPIKDHTFLLLFVFYFYFPAIKHWIPTSRVFRVGICRWGGRPEGLTYGDVIKKISRIDGLPYFSHLWCSARANLACVAPLIMFLPL